MIAEIENVERRVCKTLMEKLPFPAKETFLVAYNRGWGNGLEVDESNPFSGIFVLKWKLEKDTVEFEKLSGVFARKRNKASGTPPQVARQNADLDAWIERTKGEMRAVLREEDQMIVEDYSLGRFFNAVRDADRNLRQIQQTLAWNEEVFTGRRIIRNIGLSANGQNGREAASSKLGGTRANEKGGEE